MIASLMMYARPELSGVNERYWAAIRAELARRGIDAPKNLANDYDVMEVWTAPDLVLSQTCGMPYRLWLKNQVALIGTPDFGVTGCPPGYYNSAFVVRAQDARETLADYVQAVFAYNEEHSQSGFAAAYTHTSAAGFWFANRLQTGGHAVSAKSVANGTADIAAIDAVTWRLLQRFEQFTDDLRVLEWTSPTPGLPYITAANANVTATRDAVSAAIDGMDAQDKSDLGLRGLITLPQELYLAVKNPPSGNS